jgi:hypothetical protein
MASTINASFVTQYNEEVKSLFQQNGSKLLDRVNAHYNVVGVTYSFPRMASVAATTKTRNANVTGVDPVIDAVTCTLTDSYSSIYIDKLDELKTNANIRQSFQLASVNAIGRAVDDTIITALNTATNTLPTTAGGLTFQKLQDALTYMNKSDVDPTDRILVIGAQQMSDALAINQLTNSQYLEIGAIAQAQVGSALGFNWVLSTRLPNTNNHLAASVTTCYAFNKKAVGVAVGQAITSEVSYIPEKVSTLINTYVSLGACKIDDLGLAKMSCSE